MLKLIVFTIIALYCSIIADKVILKKLIPTISTKLMVMSLISIYTTIIMVVILILKWKELC